MTLRYLYLRTIHIFCRLTSCEDISKHACIVECGTVPPSVAELVLALVNAGTRPLADNVQNVLMSHTQFFLSLGQEVHFGAFVAPEVVVLYHRIL